MSAVFSCPATEAKGDIWGLSKVVFALRSDPGAVAPPCARGRGDLPSRDALVRIIAGLRAALFPAHYGPRELTDDGIDYFVGHTLNVTLHALREQIARGLRYAEAQEGGRLRDAEPQATRFTRELAASLPRVRQLLETDIRACYEGDPAARSLDEPLFCYPGVNAMLHHRVAHEIHELGLPLIARILSEIAHSATGIDVHPGAHIGASVFIDNGTGVVIGETAIVGERVRIHQGVTLGEQSFAIDEREAPAKGAARHPVIEDDVVIYSGATILGRITIGRGSRIGGNVWLTRSVPPGSHVTQAQARTEVFGDGAGI